MVLLAEIRAAQVTLGERVDRRGTTAVREAAPIPADLDRFVASLKTAWRGGERRPTHKRAYRRRKPVPKRGSMLDAVREEVNGWLDDEPGLSAKAVLARLRGLAPRRLQDTKLRTVQRAVKGVARPLGARDHPGRHGDAHGRPACGSDGRAFVAHSSTGAPTTTTPDRPIG